MAEIRWTDEAVRWLHDIHDYISNDSPISAAKGRHWHLWPDTNSCQISGNRLHFSERKRRNSSDSAFWPLPDCLLCPQWWIRYHPWRISQCFGHLTLQYLTWQSWLLNSVTIDADTGEGTTRKLHAENAKRVSGEFYCLSRRFAPRQIARICR